VGVRAAITAILVVIFGVQAFAILRSYIPRHNVVRYAARDGRTVSYKLLHYDPKWRRYDAALDWLGAHASAHAAHLATRDQVIATSSPHWAHLRLGLPAIMPPMEVDSEKALALIDSVPVRYLILDDFDFIDISDRYAAAIVLEHPSAWREIYADPTGGVRIFERTGM
jgi:hypothetical protein